MKILLISLKEEKEQKSKRIIKENTSSQIEILLFNFNQSFTDEKIQELDEKISSITKGKGISILLNNLLVILRKLLCDLINE